MTNIPWKQNGIPVKDDSGIPIKCTECPCGPCPSFSGRAERYVDKNLDIDDELKDGLTWETAYTDLQAALDDFPSLKIIVKGYGESDLYSPSSGSFFYVQTCTYLYGSTDFLDVYIEGIFKPKYNSLSEYCRFENIISSGSYTGFRLFENSEFSNCTVYSYSNYNAFTGCSYSEFYNCEVHDGYAAIDVSDYIVVNNCNFINTGMVFSASNYLTATDCNIEATSASNMVGSNNSIITRCTITNSSSGVQGSNTIFTDINVSGAYSAFHNMDGSTLINCEADNCTYGFRYVYNSTLTACSATNCKDCGFYGNTGSTLVDCSESNNCLNDDGDCTNSGCDDV